MWYTETFEPNLLSLLVSITKICAFIQTGLIDSSNDAEHERIYEYFMKSDCCMQ